MGPGSMCCEDRRGKKVQSCLHWGKENTLEDQTQGRGELSPHSVPRSWASFIQLSFSSFLAPSQWREKLFVCFKAIEGCHLLEDVITMLAIGLCSALPSLPLLAVGRVGLGGVQSSLNSYPLHAYRRALISFQVLLPGSGPEDSHKGQFAF